MDPLVLLNSVNEFYDSAWDKLLVYTTILVGIVGIAMPALFTWDKLPASHCL